MLVYIFNLLLISILLTNVNASEPFDKVRERYLRNLYDEIIDPSLNQKPPVSSTANELLEKTFNSLEQTGIKRENIYSQDQYQQKVKEANTEIFHQLNASISVLGDYRDKFKNDKDLSWTFNHSYLFTENRQKLPLEGYEISKNDPKNIGIVLYSQIYEIERQKIYLELTTLWKLMIFWKKNIFSENTISSYNAPNACALKNQVGNLLKIRSEALKNRPSYFDNEDQEDYISAVVDMLQNIYESLPEQIYSTVSLRKNKIIAVNEINSKIKRKNKDILNNIKSETVRFNKTYQDLIDLSINLNLTIMYLQNNFLECINHKNFISNFRFLNNSFVKYKFPTPNRTIIFNSSCLDFEKLFPQPDHYHIKMETYPLKPNMSEPLSTDIPLTELASSNLITEAESEKEEEIIWDQSYWENEHKFHQSRKAQVEKSIPNDIQEISDYEKSLYQFLLNNIYTYQKIKSRKFKELLKEYKFDVIVNKSGKGSLHYVRPSLDNPLFSKNFELAEAYFNVHLPHEDKTIIPHGYFLYLKSGFSNLFGLTESFIREKLSIL